MIKVRERVYFDLPEELELGPELASFLSEVLPNRGEGGDGMFFYYPDAECHQMLREQTREYLGRQVALADSGVVSRSRAAASVRVMRNWVSGICRREEGLDIEFWDSGVFPLSSV